jgi:hypothetical protein
LSGEQSWEKDVWLCVDADVMPEGRPEKISVAEENAVYENNMLPMTSMNTTGGELGLL